jgi:hypothetical protein
MKKASVSKCANPECDVRFKRLGDGKLFVRPAEKSGKGLKQKAMWLCQECALHFELRYRHEEFHLVHRRHVA